VTALPAPQPISSKDFWHLYVGPGTIGAASTGWSSIGAEAQRTADTVNAHADPLQPPEWDAQTSEVYHRHRRRLTDDTKELGAIAGRVAGRLEEISYTLRYAQDDLLALWDQVDARMPVFVTGLDVLFFPTNKNDEDLVHQAIETARHIRGRLDDTLTQLIGLIEREIRPLTDIVGIWRATAYGWQGWPVPADPTGTRVMEVGKRVVINTGPGDDLVDVDVDPGTNETIIRVGGVEHRYPPDQSITIRTGSGHDGVVIPSYVKAPITILAGEGNDLIHSNAATRVFGLGGNDQITTGAGNDYISAGAGNDYVDSGDGDDTVFGHTGDDVIYAMGGDDRIFGGDDNDYLEGGTGADVVAGGDGYDIVSGGRDNDLLLGGAGRDTLIGGQGADIIHGGQDEDRAYLEPAEVATDGIENEVRTEFRPGLGDGFVRVDGTSGFKARLEADLDLMRSLPEGHEVLEYFDQHHADTEGWFTDGETVTIRQKDDDDFLPGKAQWLSAARRHEVGYDPGDRVPTDGAPPSVALWHELVSHGRDVTAGTYDKTVLYTGADTIDIGTRRAERIAIGLPVADFDGDPTTEERDPAYPTVFTENEGIRKPLGLPPREHHTYVESPPPPPANY
jgi:hypothetical protein